MLATIYVTTSRALACFALSAPLLASDWYVDAVNGNDANTGTSSATAWKSITHAVASTPTGVIQTIHIAPGTYDAANGESYPIVMRDALQLIGTNGAAATILDAGGAGAVLHFYADTLNSIGFGSSTLVHDLTLRNAGVGVDVFTLKGYDAQFQDVAVENMTNIGIWVDGESTGSFPGGADGTFRRVSVVNCATGVLLDSGGSAPFGPSDVTTVFVDSQFHGGTNIGVSAFADLVSSITAKFQRCSITGYAQDGVHLTYASLVGGGGGANPEFDDCVIAKNGGNGVHIVAGTLPNGSGGAMPTLARCTIADNGSVGVESVTQFATQSQTVTLTDCIVYGNSDDILQNGTTAASYCDIGDGDFNGVNHNFSADPKFVDAPNGDFRLKWGSPCIEAGDPSTPSGTLDLASNARPIDGDLDTLEKNDVGAFEFAPLFMTTTGKLGSTLKFELWGPQGNATTVYFARKPLVSPQSTPFGQLDLNTAFMSIYRTTTVGSGPPKTITRPIPNNLAYAGLVFSFQALTDSAAAPQGKAYTNAVQITLVP